MVKLVDLHPYFGETDRTRKIQSNGMEIRRKTPVALHLYCTEVSPEHLPRNAVVIAKGYYQTRCKSNACSSDLCQCVILRTSTS